MLRSKRTTAAAALTTRRIVAMQLDVAVLAEQDAFIELLAQPRPAAPVAAGDRECLGLRIHVMETEHLDDVQPTA
jgi:hypothetical protein